MFGINVFFWINVVFCIYVVSEINVVFIINKIFCFRLFASREVFSQRKSGILFLDVFQVLGSFFFFLFNYLIVIFVFVVKKLSDRRLFCEGFSFCHRKTFGNLIFLSYIDLFLPKNTELRFL